MSRVHEEKEGEEKEETEDGEGERNPAFGSPGGEDRGGWTEGWLAVSE